MALFLSIPTIKHSDALTFKFSVIPFHLTRRNLHIRPPRFLVSSKKSSFQGLRKSKLSAPSVPLKLSYLTLIPRAWGDFSGIEGVFRRCIVSLCLQGLQKDFQEYAKPRQLLPTKELKFDMDEPLETILSALQLDGSNSLYKVQLCTSSMYGSELSDQNAGILVCIIDEHGNSILERIPSIISQDHMLQSEDAVTSEVIRFKRGAIDEFIFLGPKLGRIQAMWISLESGSWRLGGASLTMISVYNYQREESYANGGSYCSITCNFEVEDVLLGEGGDLAMAELRPCLVTEHFGADSVSIVDRNSSQAASLAEKGITNEDSMKEYENLKYSLLLYDAMLIFAGTSITSITGGKNTGLAFLTGGIGGFLYLLFLQRSVDTLPAPESMGKGNNFNRLFGGLKGPILVFASAFAIAILATRHDKPDFIAALTPREILAGMVGFLACKVSVVLAAFKPVSIMGVEDND